jgi:hypothetical protein
MLSNSPEQAQVILVSADQQISAKRKHCTLGLLKSMMLKPFIEQFSLVGGTVIVAKSLAPAYARLSKCGSLVLEGKLISDFRLHDFRFSNGFDILDLFSNQYIFNYF